MNLCTRYRSGKLNKDAFKTCAKCFKAERSKLPAKPRNETENSVITSYIETLMEGHNTSNSDNHC